MNIFISVDGDFPLCVFGLRILKNLGTDVKPTHPQPSLMLKYVFDDTLNFQILPFFSAHLFS